MRVPGGLFLCAGAVLESHWLAVGSPTDAKSPMGGGDDDNIPRYLLK